MHLRPSVVRPSDRPSVRPSVRPSFRPIARPPASLAGHLAARPPVRSIFKFVKIIQSSSDALDKLPSADGGEVIEAN